MLLTSEEVTTDKVKIGTGASESVLEQSQIMCNSLVVVSDMVRMEEGEEP